MTKPTHPKSPNLAERVALAEADHRDKVASALQEIANADQLFTKLKAEIEEADNHLADLTGQLKRGNTEVTADELASARFEAEAAELRLAGARTRLARLKKLNLNTQTDAALGLVETLRVALPGVPIHTTSAPVPDISEDEAPCVVIRQTRSSLFSDGRLSTQGTRAGIRDVEVHYARGAIHREATPADMNSAGAKLDAKVDFAGLWSAKVSDNLWLDKIKVTTAEQPKIPAISHIDLSPEGSARSLAKNVGVNWAGRCAGLTHDASHVESVTASELDGVRHLTIDGVSKGRNPEHPGDGTTLAHETPSLVGNLHVGLGRVTEVTEDRAEVDECHWTVTLVSRTGWDVPSPEHLAAA